MPSRWNESRLGDFTGRVRFRRAFGYPGRIDAYERVWLILDGIAGVAEVSLNGTRLEREPNAASHLEFDVTNLLWPRNELLVELDCNAGQSDVWRDVALEVRCTAFLRELRRIAILIEDRLDLRVAGQVVGQAERPLELYVLLEGSVVSYQVVTATAEGTPFAIRLTDLSAVKMRASEGEMRPLTVKVDLVNGAIIWYSSTEQVVVQTVT